MRSSGGTAMRNRYGIRVSGGPERPITRGYLGIGRHVVLAVVRTIVHPLGTRAEFRQGLTLA